MCSPHSILTIAGSRLRGEPGSQTLDAPEEPAARPLAMADGSWVPGLTDLLMVLVLALFVARGVSNMRAGVASTKKKLGKQD